MKSSDEAPSSALALFSFRRCPFAIRVRMVLEEKGLPYVVIEEDLGRPSTRLLGIQPSGKVPVLVHEGQVIPESSVITEYLDELCPKPALMPAAPGERAEVRLWTNWCSEIFKPDLDIYKYKWSTLSPAIQADLLKRLHRHLSHLESALSGHSFLMGEELTLADIHLFPFYRQLTRVKPYAPDLVKFPEGLDAWLERIVTRPSFLRAMAQ